MSHAYLFFQIKEHTGLLHSPQVQLSIFSAMDSCTSVSGITGATNFDHSNKHLPIYFPEENGISNSELCFGFSWWEGKQTRNTLRRRQVIPVIFKTQGA